MEAPKFWMAAELEDENLDDESPGPPGWGLSTRLTLTSKEKSQLRKSDGLMCRC